MLCCTNRISCLLAGVLLGLLYAALAQAGSVTLLRSASQLQDEGYRFMADFRITLNPQLEDALHHGITLNFSTTFNITRPRSYWMDQEIAHSEQITKLSYHALTKQYRVSRGNLFQSYGELEQALRALGHQVSPVYATDLFDTDEGVLQRLDRKYLGGWLRLGSSYVVTVRFMLDTAQLPKPLQVNALADNEWHLVSEEYRWEFAPRSAESEP